MSHENKPGKWSETCIGLWSRSVCEQPPHQQPSSQTPVCMGINLVRVKVSFFSHGRSLIIHIQAMLLHTNQKKKQESGSISIVLFQLYEFINFFKDTKLDAIQPTNTIGLQIIIQDTSGKNKQA